MHISLQSAFVTADAEISALPLHYLRAASIEISAKRRIEVGVV